jgi:hypothetical protein
MERNWLDKPAEKILHLTSRWLIFGYLTTTIQPYNIEWDAKAIATRKLEGSRLLDVFTPIFWRDEGKPRKISVRILSSRIKWYLQ